VLAIEPEAHMPAGRIEPLLPRSPCARIVEDVLPPSLGRTLLRCRVSNRYGVELVTVANLLAQHRQNCMRAPAGAVARGGQGSSNGSNGEDPIGQCSAATVPNGSSVGASQRPSESQAEAVNSRRPISVCWCSAFELPSSSTGGSGGLPSSLAAACVQVFAISRKCRRSLSVVAPLANSKHSAANLRKSSGGSGECAPRFRARTR
jgi:hypothetical protein